MFRLGLTGMGCCGVAVVFSWGRESGCDQVSGFDSLSLTFGVSGGELVRWIWVRDELVLL